MRYHVSISVLILSLIIPVAQAQKGIFAPGGFLGMSWGVPKDSVMQLMQSIEETLFDSEKSKSTKLIFIGGEYEEKEVDQWIFEFVSDRFLKASVVFEIKKEKLLQTFRELKLTLNNIYGKPLTDLDEFNISYPAREAGKETDALAEGKYQLLAGWFFPSESNTKEIISISAERDFTVTITFVSTMIGK